MGPAKGGLIWVAEGGEMWSVMLGDGEDCYGMRRLSAEPCGKEGMSDSLLSKSPTGL